MDRAGQFTVIDCTSCSFKHAVPIPKPENRHSYYAHEFLAERPLYIERYEDDMNWWKMVCEEKYEILESILPASRRKLLDVGCGLGLFIQTGLERGWTATGIEPAEQSAAYARSRGVDVISEAFSQEMADRLGTFDVVHMHEVLEHLPDPVSTLSAIHGLVGQDGLLCVVVPNDYNPLQRLLREQRGFDPWWVAPPIHLNYFDFDSLRGLLEKSGFRAVETFATFPMEFFLLMGENYIGNDAVGRRCHGLRKSLELNLRLSDHGRLKSALYSGFAESGIGREILMVARREPHDA
jgi:2-polyprenyl-3-methyl-5-hydroxy-6-metoxy-1,4-benzoquinol methylase